MGTEFSTHMVMPQGVEAWTTGRFTEVDPPRLLAYVTDPDPKLGVGEMQVRVVFAEVGGRTEVTLTHSGIPNDMIRDVIQQGWTASTAQLVSVLPTVAAP